MILHPASSKLADMEKVLEKTLRDCGCVLKKGPYGERARAVAREWHPFIVLAEMTPGSLADDSAWETIADIKRHTSASTIMILDETELEAMEDNVRQKIEDHSDDFITRPFTDTELLMRLGVRLKLHMSDKETREDRRRLESILAITNAVSSSLELEDVFDVIVKSVAEAVGAADCSVVQVEKDGKQGIVLDSFKTLPRKNLELELARYPELRKVMETRKPLAISDLSIHPLMNDVRETVKDLVRMSALVIPIVFDDAELGTMFLRAKKVGEEFSEKDLNLCKLVADASFFAIKNAHLYEKVSEQKTRLEQIAITDQLTDLYNHNHFYERLSEEFSRADRYGVDLSLIMMDIDDFKKINDTHGHRVGDKILKKIAKLLKNCVRKSDVVARYGGEEFAVILPYTALKGAMEEAERIRALVNEHDFGPEISERVTMSFGVATYMKDMVRDTGDLVNRADKALYRAKAKGKNCAATIDDGAYD
jgi:diguanylate cyclase (GGDEF)-like protein